MMTDFLTQTDIILIILGVLISWAYTQIKAAIKGTALEGELGELLEITVKAAMDGKITPAEGRAIGKQGIDSLWALKEFVKPPKDK